MAKLDLKKSIKGISFFTKRLNIFGTAQKNGDQYFSDRRGFGVVRDMEYVKRNGERVKIRGVVDAGGKSMVIPRPGSSIGGMSASAAMDSYRDWVFSAVRPIAEEIGNIEWRLKMVKDNSDVDNHDVLDFLETVNDFQTSTEFKQTLATHLELTGNAYVLLLDNKGMPVTNYDDQPQSMYLLNPSNVTINLNKSIFPYKILNYKFIYDGREKIFEPYAIVHIKYPNPTNPYIGMGTVQGISGWIDNDNNSTEFLNQFFKNGAQIGVTFETEMTSEEQLHELRDSFNEQHSGVEHAYKAMFLPKGVTRVKDDVKFDDIGFDTIGETNRDKILAGFRVSKTIMGTAESEINRATAETADYVFSKRTIKPKMTLICDYLNNFLIPRFGSDIYLTFTDPVPEDKLSKSTEMKNAIGQSSVLTINEAREEYMGREPIDGGDLLLIPNNLIPATDAGTYLPQGTTLLAGRGESKSKTYTSKKFTEPVGYILQRKSNGKSQFSRNSDIRKELSKGLVDKLADIIMQAKSKELKDLTDIEYDDIVLKAKRDRNAGYAKEMVTELRKINDDQKKEVLENLGSAIKSAKAIDVDALFNMSKWVNITINAIKPIAEKLFQKEADYAMAVIDKPGLDIVNTPRAQDAIDKAMQLMAQSYNQDTVDILETKLSEGLEQGFGVQKLGELVSTIYEFKDEYAAERVALTESNRISNDAGKMVWKDSGYVKEVKWVTSGRDVCEFCKDMDGDIISIDENFFEKGDTYKVGDATLDLDYSAVGGPPLHPNCHCGIRPVVSTTIEAGKVEPDQSKEVEDAIKELQNL